MNYFKKIRVIDKESNLIFWRTKIELLQEIILQGKDPLSGKSSVFLYGIFYPINSEGLKSILPNENNILISENLNPEVDYILCDVYPDWNLIEKANMCCSEIVYVDGEGSIFNIKAANLEKIYYSNSFLQVMKF